MGGDRRGRTLDVAPSFADIFRMNCLKNGVLPVTLPMEDVRTLLMDAATPETSRLTVDLAMQHVRRVCGAVIPFEIDGETAGGC